MASIPRGMVSKHHLSRFEYDINRRRLDERRHHKAAMSPGPLALTLAQAIRFRLEKRGIPTTDLLQSTPLIAPDLFSNDYLSLTYDPALHAAALKKLSEASLILGSGGSRLLNGNTAGHVALEARMKDLFGTPAALLCNSGYDANIVFWRSIPQTGDIVVFDELVHASTRDGIAECRAKGALYSFEHNSVTSFRECVARALASHPAVSQGKATLFVALESLYSMDGDFAPLHELVQVLDELVPPDCSHIVVDEAHSTGICGPGGRGLVAALGLTARVDTVIHTFGKARAAIGGKRHIPCIQKVALRSSVLILAAIVTSPIVRQYIITYGRAFIFSTSIPGALVSILEASFDHIESSAGDEVCCGFPLRASAAVTNIKSLC